MNVTQLTLLGALVLTAGQEQERDAPSPEESAIREVLDEYIAARNRGDAERLASFFAEDYDQANLTMGRLQIRSGKERAAAYEEAFRERRIQNELQSEVANLRFVTDDVALLDTELAFVNREGNVDFHNYATFLFVERGGRWLIGAVRLAPYSKNAPER